MNAADGGIGSTWKLPSLRYVARFIYGDSLPGEVRDDDGDVLVYGSNGVVGVHDAMNTHVPAIIVGRKGSYGKVTWADQGGFVIDTAYIVDRRTTNEDLRWLFYALQTLRLDESSQDTGVPGLSREAAYGTRVPVPPLPTQRAIADFLDRRTAAIDALIEKKQKLLELLAEKRTALINRAVTKGLDPDVPMKDSGVPWIGEIPAHWEVTTFRRRLKSIEQGWSPQCEARAAAEDEWGVLKVGCVNGGSFNPAEHKALPHDLAPRPHFQVQHGDLLMSRANTSELVGSAAVVGPVDGRRLMLCDKLYRLHLSPAVRQAFVVLALNARYVRAQHEATSSGASSSMQNISQEKVRDLVLALPSPDEQSFIADQIERRCPMDDALLDLTTRQLDRLREYRQALITAAVTGQIDVEGAA